MTKCSFTRQIASKRADCLCVLQFCSANIARTSNGIGAHAARMCAHVCAREMRACDCVCVCGLLFACGDVCGRCGVRMCVSVCAIKQANLTDNGDVVVVIVVVLWCYPKRGGIGGHVGCWPQLVQLSCS